jgi:hypothetical protein
MCENKPEFVVLVAEQIRNEIAGLAEKFDISVCEIEAEILSQSLMSDDCDKCHVHWLEFHTMLEHKLQKH